MQKQVTNSQRYYLVVGLGLPFTVTIRVSGRVSVMVRSPHY